MIMASVSIITITRQYVSLRLGNRHLISQFSEGNFAVLFGKQPL